MVERSRWYVVVLLLMTLGFSSAHAVDSGLENLRQTGKAFAAVARQVSPSVVLVQVESERLGEAAQSAPAPFGEGWPFNEEFLRRFFGDPRPGLPNGESPDGSSRAIGQGSGFIFLSRSGASSGKTDHADG